MAETLSEQVAKLEEALRNKQKALDIVEKSLAILVKRVAQAWVEGARSALTDIHKAIAFDPITVNQIRAFRDREYPAPASGEEGRPDVCADCGHANSLHLDAASECWHIENGLYCNCGLHRKRPTPSPVERVTPEPFLLNVLAVGYHKGEPCDEGTGHFIRVTPADARRIVALASRPTASGEG